VVCCGGGFTSQADSEVKRGVALACAAGGGVLLELAGAM
jgi:hypothetical protein